MDFPKKGDVVPFKNFHSCRLRASDQFVAGSLRTIVRANGGNIVVGRLKDRPTVLAKAGMRFPTATFSEEQAREQCSMSKGREFSAARIDGDDDHLGEPVLVPRGVKLLGDLMIDQLSLGMPLNMSEDDPLMGIFGNDDDPDDNGDEGDELATENLYGVEILAAGTWRSMEGRTATLTVADLREAASNFVLLKDRVKPFLKAGHMNDVDHVKMTGMPALGWMENVRVKGNRLLADFTNVPRKIGQLIRAKAYRRISAELVRDWTDPSDGRKYGIVLRAAGMLGATAPAINVLKDILGNYAAQHRDVENTSIAFEPALVFSLAEPVTEGEIDMEDLKKLQEQVAALTQRVETGDAAIRVALGIGKDDDIIGAATKLKNDAERSAKALADQRTQSFAEKLSSIKEKAKREGRLTPAMEPTVDLIVRGLQRDEKDSTDGTVSFAIYDGKKNTTVTVSGSVIEVVGKYLDSLPKSVRLSEEMGAGESRQSFGGEGDEDEETEKEEKAVNRIPADARRFAQQAKIGIDRGSAALDDQIQTIMDKDKSLSYVEALQRAADVQVPQYDSEEIALATSGRLVKD